MPESPEVQAFADALAERAAGRRVAAVDVVDFRTLKTRDPAPDVLVGHPVSGVLRHGKWVDIATDAGHLAISFGRHGWAVWYDGSDGGATASDAPPVVARMRFDDGGGFDLTDAGSFRSAAIWIVADPRDVPSIARLGPDPADIAFTRADFDRAVGGRRKQLKALLQEQDTLAGIGNAYSDEILFAARLAPTRHAADLDDDEQERWFTATRDVIRTAIDQRRGIPIAELKVAKVAAMKVHGRTGEPCPGCDGVVADIGARDSGGQYCPACQT